MMMTSGDRVLSTAEVVWAEKVLQGVLVEGELPARVSEGEKGAVGAQVAPVVRVVEEGLEALAPI